MRVIYKYPLALMNGVQEIEMPHGAKIVHVAGQHEIPTLWAEVLPTAELVKREFVVYGTGHTIMFSDHKYIGTAHCPPFAWHVYEVVQE